ncbi:MAG TPA: hypothetical protein VF251_04875 [Pyrinomonadaceae bacterium]
MKKAALAASVIVIALLLSARWATMAVNAPAQDLVQSAPNTSLANALSVEDMVHKSDLIAIGNCVGTKSVWVGRSLVTLATVAVGETIKGTEQREITVALPGGIDANREVPIAMNYAGAPRMTPGEDVLVFLRAGGPVSGTYTIAGLSQGKFSIVKDEAGREMVTRDLTKMMLRSNNGVHRGSNNMRPLASFKAEIKAHLRQQ